MPALIANSMTVTNTQGLRRKGDLDPIVLGLWWDFWVIYTFFLPWDIAYSVQNCLLKTVVWLHHQNMLLHFTNSSWCLSSLLLSLFSYFCLSSLFPLFLIVVWHYSWGHVHKCPLTPGRHREPTTKYGYDETVNFIAVIYRSVHNSLLTGAGWPLKQLHYQSPPQHGRWLIKSGNLELTAQLEGHSIGYRVSVSGGLVDFCFFQASQLPGFSQSLFFFDACLVWESFLSSLHGVYTLEVGGT